MAYNLYPGKNLVGHDPYIILSVPHIEVELRKWTHFLRHQSIAPYRQLVI